MNTTNYLSSLRQQFVSPQGAVALLSLLGAAKRRRRSSATPWIVGGLVVGAGAALLFGTERGKTLRSRFGSTIGSGIGEVVGGVMGAHPVRTAQLVDNVKEKFASRGS